MHPGPVLLQMSGEWRLIAAHNSYQREAGALPLLRGWERPETLLLFLFSLRNPREELRPSQPEMFCLALLVRSLYVRTGS